jgi:hypothetical protein
VELVFGELVMMLRRLLDKEIAPQVQAKVAKLVGALEDHIQADGVPSVTLTSKPKQTSESPSE